MRETKRPVYAEQDEDGNLQHETEMCENCGFFLEHVYCWQCDGEGGFHNCWEDTCCCLEKEVITEDCDICDGKGGYLVCFNCHPELDETYHD